MTPRRVQVQPWRQLNTQQSPSVFKYCLHNTIIYHRAKNDRCLTACESPEVDGATMFLASVVGTSVDILDIIFRVGIISNISTIHIMETPD